MFKKLLTVQLILLLFLLSNCKKDKDHLYDITGNVQYSVMLVPAGNSSFSKKSTSILKTENVKTKTTNKKSGLKITDDNPSLAGAQISIKQNLGNGTSGINDSIVLTSNDNGVAVFRNLVSGFVTVSVKFSNGAYTDVDFIADLTSATSDAVYNASTIVPVFPLTGTGTAKSIITGTVTYESDLTNLTPEAAENVPITLSIDTHTSFINTYLSNNDNPGKIIKISYHNIVTPATTDVNGNYSITVPSTANGLKYNINVNDIERGQTLLMNTMNGQTVEGTQQISTIFGSSIDGINNSPSAIPTVSPVYIHFSAPTGTVGGSLMSPATANALFNTITGKLDSISIPVRGSGYTQTPNVIIWDNPIPPNGHGATATAATPDINGSINKITLINKGSGYINPRVSIIMFYSLITAKGTVNVDANGVINSTNGVFLLDNNNIYSSTPSGNGYITEPTVSFVPSIAGMGSGASARAVINSSGQICNVIFDNLGSGYIAKNYPVNAQPFQITPNGNSFTVESGKTYIKNIYLGTGKRTIEN